MNYIRQARVDYPGTSNEHISDVQTSISVSGTLNAQTRESVVRAIDSGGAAYRSHNDNTGDEARVETRTSARGIRYVTTVADGRETNNLLNLPRF